VIPILPIILAVIIGPSYLILEVEPGYLFGLDVYDPLTSPVLALLVSVLPLLEGELLVRWLRRRMAAPEFSSRVPGLGRRLFLHRMSVPAVYALAVYVLHWPRVIDDLGIKGWILLDKIVVLFPFAISLLCSWATAYRVQRLVRPRETGRLGPFLLFQLRITALPVVPIVVVVLLVDVVENTESLRILFEQFPYLVWCSVLGFLVMIFLFMPLCLRLIWSVTPLPEGPLRNDLLSLSKELGFRCRNILVWKTQGDIVNAAIIGLLGSLRYVILTDGLLRHLQTDEIRAVFAHEVGHARKKHLHIYFAFSVAFIFLFLSAERHLLPQGDETAGRLLLYLFVWSAIFVVYWWIILGFLSRRFECQADLFGAKAVGDTEVFVSALEKISALSGNLRTKRSWRHFSVAQRVAFLRAYDRDPAVRRRFALTVVAMMSLFWGMSAITLAVGATEIREQHLFGLARRKLESGSMDSAEELCRRLLELNPHDPRYPQLLGNILQAELRIEEALEAYRLAYERSGRYETERRRSLQRTIERLEGS
jgi:Zn-dependent protease with chaperone function